MTINRRDDGKGRWQSHEVTIYTGLNISNNRSGYSSLYSFGDSAEASIDEAVLAIDEAIAALNLDKQSLLRERSSGKQGLLDI